MQRKLGWMMVWGILLAVGFRIQAQPIGLSTDDGGRQASMVLEKLRVEAKIFGPVAETRMTMTFRNPRDRQLAGELYFPLPEGAFVSGYALDVNGVMVDGVVVEKEKARQVFEELTRQRIDPGLVEWSRGNNFKTRVFPLPPKGTRTIMVRYVSEISVNDQGAFFQLPLKQSGVVGEFSLRVEVRKGPAAPVVQKGGMGHFAFKEWRENWVAEASQKDGCALEDLRIMLPQGNEPGAWVEKSPDGEYYFVIADQTSGGEDEGLAAMDLRRIVIFWDASNSRLKADHEREYMLLKSFFANHKDVGLEVNLVVFRNETERAKNYKVIDGDCEKLLTELRTLSYDGGTQIGCLKPITPKPDCYLLFSDGLSNFGQEQPEAFDAPLYAVCGEDAADHAFLHSLAEPSGGEYLNLARMGEKEAADRIGRVPYSFMRLQLLSGEVADAVPGNRRPESGRFIMAGRLQSEKARLTLAYGYGDKVVKASEWLLDRGNAANGSLLRTLWAQKRIGELMASPEENGEQLTAIGKKYGLVTPGTSLLVLDNLQQYVRYKVLPPESLPQMRQEYLRLVEQERGEQKRHENDKIGRMLAAWRERIAWWSQKWAPFVPSAAKAKPTTQSPERPPVRNFLPGSGIGGTITDPDGELLPGASVTLSGNGANWETISNESGGYLFRNLQPGTYSLRAELEGFKTVTVRDIRLRANSGLRYDIQLPLANIQEEIVVASNAPVVNTKSTAKSLAVSRSERQSLPAGRDPDSILSMAPGAQTDRENMAGSNKNGGHGKHAGPGIALQAWNPQAPYIEALRQAGPERAYEEYLKQRDALGRSPGFYLDCADYFFSIKEEDIGLRILSNIAELELENGQLLRILGHRLEQVGRLELSASVFEAVLKLRPEEPQSWRDLALVLAAQKKYERAIELLNHVVMADWDSRFPEIEIIALMELNEVIGRARAAGRTEFRVSPRLIQLLDVDIRIVLTWDADDTDIDLWVVEPTEEKAFYSHNRTSIGGLVSRDFTRGYGPEEYLIRRAMKGKYKIQANYFGTRSQILIGPVTVQADVFTNFGRPNQAKKSLTLRLAQSKDTVTVGEIEF